MEDEKIVELFMSRDELAISATREKYGKLLFGISKHILGSGADAEECLSDALLVLWQTVPAEKPHCLKAYSCKVIRNLSLKRLSYNLAEKRSPDSEISLDGIETALPDSAAREAFEMTELTVLLNDFLRTLKPDARVMFVRRYFFFDSVSDIASDLGLGASKVKTTLWRTRAELKKYLSGKGSAL